MKLTVLTMMFIICCTSSAVAKTSQHDISDTLDKAFDNVSTSSYNYGFNKGVMCGLELVQWAKNRADVGDPMLPSEVSDYLEQCRKGTKKETDIK